VHGTNKIPSILVLFALAMAIFLLIACTTVEPLYKHPLDKHT
jgi:hypothetical protein